jgi:hypothetical protein
LPVKSTIHNNEKNDFLEVYGPELVPAAPPQNPSGITTRAIGNPTK